MHRRCPTCDQGILEHGQTEETFVVAGRHFTAHLEALCCPMCGETLVDASVLSQFDLAVARHLARGEPSGEAFAMIRKALGLQGREVADLLHTTVETLTQWEKGSRPMDWATFALLGKILLEHFEGKRETLEYLTRLGTSDVVTIELGHL